jgi:hypothetical protein
MRIVHPRAQLFPTASFLLLPSAVAYSPCEGCSQRSTAFLTRRAHCKAKASSMNTKPYLASLLCKGPRRAKKPLLVAWPRIADGRQQTSTPQRINWLKGPPPAPVGSLQSLPLRFSSTSTVKSRGTEKILLAYLHKNFPGPEHRLKRGKRRKGRPRSLQRDTKIESQASNRENGRDTSREGGTRMRRRDGGRKRSAAWIGSLPHLK